MGMAPKAIVFSQRCVRVCVCVYVLAVCPINGQRRYGCSQCSRQFVVEFGFIFLFFFFASDMR